MKSTFNPACFELVILDRDRKLFFIVGPMSNDTATHELVLERQRAGRNLEVHGLLNLAATRAENIAQVALQTGFLYRNDVPLATLAVILTNGIRLGKYTTAIQNARGDDQVQSALRSLAGRTV